MNVLESFLYGVASFEVLGNKANILGFFWLIALTIVAYKRFHVYFENGYYPKPKGNRWKGIMWVLVLVLISWSCAWLTQLLMDDAITTPISIVFGSWKLLSVHVGEFSFLKLFLFKWDVYALIFVHIFFFSVIRLWRFFQFTKWSALCLTSAIVFQVIVSSFGIFGSHIWYEGWDRITIFWLTYPEFRIITGFFFASIIRKPKVYA